MLCEAEEGGATPVGTERRGVAKWNISLPVWGMPSVWETYGGFPTFVTEMVEVRKKKYLRAVNFQDLH